MRQYRKRLKENKEVYNKTKEKDRQRKATKRSQLTKSQVKKHRESNKVAVNKYRKEKKTSEISAPIKIFKTPQALGKAKSRIKQQLPKSPRHKRELVMSLAHEYGMKSPIDSLGGNRSICEETIQKVKSYFLENSWTCPGRKDVVIVCDRKKGKEKRQKHYMMTILKEAHSLFKTENPGCKTYFSKF